MISPVKTKSPVIVLENEHLRVGVINRGGRVVLFQRSGGNNVLKVDPGLLDGAAVRPRRISPRYRFKQWNGHTVWCGPQSAFWSDQDIHPIARRRHAVWPPDPYGEIGWFTTIEKTDRAIVLQGPESAVTGLQLTKTIELAHRTVRFSTSARNVRNQPVSWDLWPNTRVDGFSRVFVPAVDGAVLRIQGGRGHGTEAMEHRIADGFFTFEPQLPSPAARQRVAKAFLHPPQGLIAAFCGSDLFRIRFDPVPRQRIHPEQALVELFNMTSGSGGSLLELETHSPFRTLQPGETMHVEQTWDIQEYPGEDSDSARVAFVKAL